MNTNAGDSQAVLRFADAAQLAGSQLGWPEANRTCTMQGMNANVRILKTMPVPGEAGRVGWTRGSVQRFIAHFRKS